jgi:NitT/TauT family transport system substrate-binding protein
VTERKALKIMKERYFMKTGKASCFSLVVLLALLVTACVSAAATPERPPLKVAWSLWPGYYPMAIAIEQGLFAKHGAAIEPVFYTNYATQLPDFQAGKVDGIFFTLGDALLVDGGSPDSLRVVLVTDNSAGADVIVATADIATAADVRGKSIGANLGSFGELLVNNMLQANGLTPGDVTLVNIGPEGVPGAMPDTIQAGHTWEPFTSEARAKDYHVIFSSTETPGLIPDVVAFRTSVIQERPEDVRAFIAAWFEALAYWQANPTEGNAIIAKHTGLKPEEVSAEGVKLFNLADNTQAFARGTDTISLYGSGQVNIEFLISTGGLTTAPEIERLLDPSFLK